MDILLIPLLKLILAVLSLYQWVIIIYVVLSWLFFFGILNTSNQFVGMVATALSRLVEPVLRPIRRFIPIVGGLDLSILVLFLAIYFAESVLFQIMLRLA